MAYVTIHVVICETVANSNIVAPPAQTQTATNADLTSSSLTDADLTNSSLTNAILFNVNLTNADLRDSNLTDADLTLTRLNGSIFNRESLITANLTGNTNQIHIVDLIVKFLVASRYVYNFNCGIRKFYFE